VRLATGALVRALVLTLAAIGYAVLCHLSNSGRLPPAAGVALAVVPLLAAALLLTARSRFRYAAWLACALVALLAYRESDFLANHFAWLYLLQQVAAYAALGIMFGRTLRAGRVPLCTQWATLVHGTLPAAAVPYTRAVTAAWAIFFALLAAALIVVFALAPLPAWSAFANFGTFPLIVAMFIGEYLVRIRALPDMPPAHIIAGVRAYIDSARPPAAARRG
jgi:uncharacterized membrane protein